VERSVDKDDASEPRFPHFALFLLVSLPSILVRFCIGLSSVYGVGNLSLNTMSTQNYQPYDSYHGHAPSSSKSHPVYMAIDERGFTRKEARRNKRVKVLRVVQSVLSSLLSLSIAAFQARVFATFQRTRTVDEDVWPRVPNTSPTIMLFVVAITSLVFDVTSKLPASPCLN
jgi:hypothetical protein